MFTVIVPVFNRQRLVRRTIDSVLKAAPEGTQVIAVDDGSSDDSLGVLQSYGDRLQIATQSRSGPGAARNRGIELATGEYIVFVDSDDMLFPWSIAVYRELINRHDSPALLIASAVHFRSEDELLGVTQAPTNAVLYADYLAAAPATMWHGSSAIVARTDVLRAVGGFAGAHVNGEDSDLLLRLGVAPGFVRILSPATVAYRTHDASATADLTKTAMGIRHIVANDAGGRYPGGPARRQERDTIITRHSRAMTLQATRHRRLWEAAPIYVATIAANLRQGRLRYVLGFPVVWLWHALIGGRRHAVRSDEP